MIRQTVAVIDVEQIVGPVAEWPGRCYEIACKMVKAGLIKGRAVYGHWTGKVARGTLFYGKPLIHHGWIDIGASSYADYSAVCDPTRWVFEGKRPYIFVGGPESLCDDFEAEENDSYICRCGCPEDAHKANGFFRACYNCSWPYDEGGNQYILENEKPAPAANQGEPLAVKLEERALWHVRGLLGHEPTTIDDWFWVANLALPRLNHHAKAIYQAVIATNHGGFIPLDNRFKIVGEKRPKKTSK